MRRDCDRVAGTVSIDTRSVATKTQRNEETQKEGGEVVVRGVATAERLDRVLRRLFPTWGRQAVQRLIATRQVLVNGQAVWLASWQVHDGDRLTLLTQPQPKPPAATVFAAEWLLAVETDMIVVDKPAGLLAEPTRWVKEPTCVTWRRLGLGH